MKGISTAVVFIFSRQQPVTGLRNPLFQSVGCRTLLAAYTEAEVPFLDRRAHPREQHYCCKNCFYFSSSSWQQVWSQLEKNKHCGLWAVACSLRAFPPLQCLRGHLAERHKCLCLAKRSHGKGPHRLLLPMALQDSLSWHMPLSWSVRTPARCLSR